MNYKKIFWGLLLIIIGLLFIFRNLGWLDFNWWAIFSLWPVLLILWGISLIPVKEYIKLLLAIATLIISVVFLYNYDSSHHFQFRVNHNFRGDDFEEGDNVYKYSDQDFSQPFDSLTKNASLQFEAAAGNFTIDSVTDKLVEFQKKGNVTNYQFTTEDTDSGKIIKFKMDDVKLQTGRRHHTNKVELKLNPNPTWDFNFEIGAAEINFDLSSYKTRKVSIDCGASDIDLTLGNKHPETNVNIDAGASSIKIRVPKTSAYKVISDSFMASKSFEDAKKVSDGIYQTKDFRTNTQKIIINLNVGVSSLEVERY
ncbi:MAG: cell wall-active antibiotics response protein [Lentimicrobiaceae bacterium]|nr:cell wall-active antibiotics response protein [Lentimicrobiaceae bacterium]